MPWVTFKTMALIGLCFRENKHSGDLTDSNVCGPEKISKTAARCLPGRGDHGEHPSCGSPSSDLNAHGAALELERLPQYARWLIKWELVESVTMRRGLSKEHVPKMERLGSGPGGKGIYQSHDHLPFLIEH